MTQAGVSTTQLPEQNIRDIQSQICFLWSSAKSLELDFDNTSGFQEVIVLLPVFPLPALLWKGRYNPSWCMHYPAARTKYQRFHRYSLRFSPFVWVPWVQSFSCPGLYVPLSGLPLERSLWPILVYICRYRQNISCRPLQDLPFLRCLDWAQL